MYEKGQQIATETKESIGKNLMNALKTQKTEDALTFCNRVAIPLTNNQAKTSNVSIKRATDKARNPNNLATIEELKYINIFKKEILSGKTPTPVIISANNEYRFYAPIITSSICLQCHGKINSDIKSGVLQKLKTLYPNDKATGYSSNELRGVFSIVWSNKH